jgi:hypothetical protein
VKLLDKLLRRDTSDADHAKWLSEHPGKGAMPTISHEIDADEEAAMRQRMEAELDAQRAKRG